MEREVMRKRQELIDQARKDILVLTGDGKVEGGQNQVDRRSSTYTSMKIMAISCSPKRRASTCPLIPFLT